MTNDDAKFILQAYRPNGADAGDVVFHPPLQQAKQDDALGRWFERQQAFDRAVAAKLNSIEPPADLRAAIIAGAGVSRPAARSRWRQPRWLALAASLAVLLSVSTVGVLKTHARQTDDLPVFAMDYVAGGFFLSRHNANVDELRSWLASRHAPLPEELPAGFAKLRSLGCKTIDYRGKDVSLICFGEGKEYHLFVARRNDFPKLPAAGATPKFIERPGYASAAWSDDQNHYVLVTDDSLQALKACLHCNGT